MSVRQCQDTQNAIAMCFQLHDELGHELDANKSDVQSKVGTAALQITLEAVFSRALGFTVCSHTMVQLPAQHGYVKGEGMGGGGGALNAVQA